MSSTTPFKRALSKPPSNSNSLHDNDDSRSLPLRPFNGNQTKTKAKRRCSPLDRIVAVLFLLCCSLAGFNVFHSHATVIEGSSDGTADKSPSTKSLHLLSNPQDRNQLRPTNHACDGYTGVYHIRQGDVGGAAGTIFFQFVIGQLIYAEKYNLKPWVHLNNVSYVIYDPEVHGKGPGATFQMMDGMEVSSIFRERGHWRDIQPGPPQIPDGLVPKEYHFPGTGVWDQYFEPVSDFVPGDTSCANKPLVTMDLKQITPGVHGYSDWAPRCWRYKYLQDYITKPHVPLLEWLEPQRHLANDALKRYIKFQPHLQQKASEFNPSCSMQNSCLGLHIRHSDKASGRRQIETYEFLPFAEAFVKQGGKHIYLATDSSKVLDEINARWPESVKNIIRTMGSAVIRSTDDKAVFDIASHHRTNTEILIEILALSKCQFMLYGLSAVTETSIWINVDLHYTSVNLEDPEHQNPSQFAKLVYNVLHGEDAKEIMLSNRASDWWKKNQTVDRVPTNAACDGYDGILHIAHVGSESSAATAFFVSVLNQLIYAKQNNLKPWIHLDNGAPYIYDDKVHREGRDFVMDTMTNGLTIDRAFHDFNRSLIYPGKTSKREVASPISKKFNGSGVWENYFLPVSDFVPTDSSCEGKAMLSISPSLVAPGLNSWAPSAVRPWRYDDVPDQLWEYPPSVMRKQAEAIIKEYYKFQPHIIDQANKVNPINESCIPCLAVHLQNAEKTGKFRSKFAPGVFKEYMEAFLEAGGEAIYVASDSHNAAQRFPLEIRQIIRTQGPYVVRFSKKWQIRELEQHHRTNSEALVDILAMSKCKFLLHGSSAMSEAVTYLNPSLQKNSINWEVEAERISVETFSQRMKTIFESQNGMSCLSAEEKAAREEGKKMLSNKQAANLTIIREPNRPCGRHAIVYLAQKHHSSYKRDSFANLLESLRLLEINYLSNVQQATATTDIFIFHTGDFNSSDMDQFNQVLSTSSFKALHLIDLSLSHYWRRPSWHEFDDPTEWYAFPLFSEGYRRMIHFFAIDIWKFFADYNSHTGCNYTYVMRLDEDSYIRSRIDYDLFDFMEENNHDYGFRLCAYEMHVATSMWNKWKGTRGKNIAEKRKIEGDMCGIYNNFFIARIEFFQSWPVAPFLGFVDRQGMIYRRRLGDLMIHSMAVFAFAAEATIHRFLDFTYEHATHDQTTGCVVWGGIQAGFKDDHADAILSKYHQENVIEKGCAANVTTMRRQDLSPRYSHLEHRDVALQTMMAGKVELPGMGLLSG